MLKFFYFPFDRVYIWTRSVASFFKIAFYRDVDKPWSLIVKKKTQNSQTLQFPWVSCYTLPPLDGAGGPWTSPCCVWQKQPPVGAVLGHVAERSGAVFISDPGPSVKKKSPSGKKKKKKTGLGMHNGTSFPGGNWGVSTLSEHGPSLSLRNKPSSRWCGRPVTF